MRRIFGGERGAISNYVIGVTLLIIILVGSVFFLKNLSERNLDRDDNDYLVLQPEDSEENNEQTDDRNDDTDSQNGLNGNSNGEDNSGSGNANQEAEDSQNGAQANQGGAQGSDGALNEIPITGPEEITKTFFGILFAIGGIYTVREFYLSRKKLTEALLKSSD